jgi:hypothetical protein
MQAGPKREKVNCRTRSMQSPRGYAPLHFRRNQRSGRRTAAQEAYNRPAVVRPLSFAATGGPTWGSRPTCHATGVPVTGCGKSHRRSRQYHVSSRSSQKTEKISFQNQCSDSRPPVHGPTVTLSTKVTGQSTAGTGVAVGVTIGGSTVITSTGAQEQQANRQSDSGPTCCLVSSPEAGPGATIGTLNQGYPLLQYKDVVHVRRLLAARERHPTPPHGLV